MNDLIRSPESRCVCFDCQGKLVNIYGVLACQNCQRIIYTPLHDRLAAKKTYANCKEAISSLQEKKRQALFSILPKSDAGVLTVEQAEVKKAMQEYSNLTFMLDGPYSDFWSDKARSTLYQFLINYDRTIDLLSNLEDSE